MTIDEAIEQHKQIAEWLEELKLARKIIYEYSQDEELITAYKSGVKAGRTEVIDEVKELMKKYVGFENIDIFV